MCYYACLNYFSDLQLSAEPHLHIPSCVHHWCQSASSSGTKAVGSTPQPAGCTSKHVRQETQGGSWSCVSVLIWLLNPGSSATSGWLWWPELHKHSPFVFWPSQHTAPCVFSQAKQLVVGKISLPHSIKAFFLFVDICSFLMVPLAPMKKL